MMDDDAWRMMGDMIMMGGVLFFFSSFLLANQITLRVPTVK